MVACSNPLKEATTVDQKAYALYGTFVVFEEAGAKIVVNPTVPAEAKAAIKKADGIAKLVADSLLTATMEFIKVKAAYDAGKTDQAKLTIATNNLNSWITESTPAIQNLVKAVGAK